MRSDYARCILPPAATDCLLKARLFQMPILPRRIWCTQNVIWRFHRTQQRQVNDRNHQWSFSAAEYFKTSYADLCDSYRPNWSISSLWHTFCCRFYDKVRRRYQPYCWLTIKRISCCPNDNGTMSDDASSVVRKYCTTEKASNRRKTWKDSEGHRKLFIGYWVKIKLNSIMLSSRRQLRSWSQTSNELEFGLLSLDMSR